MVTDVKRTPPSELVSNQAIDEFMVLKSKKEVGLDSAFGMPYKNAGFTLIELMVVVAIIAILTIVAYPSYQESIRKSRRADAVAAILAIQAAEEKFRANCQFYAETFVDAAAGNDCLATAALSEVVASDTSPDEYYSMAVSGATGNTYIITATAQGAQAADTLCPTMTITFNTLNPNGLKTPPECWP